MSKTPLRDSERVIRQVYRDAGVTDSGSYLTTVNQLTDQLPALEPDTLAAATDLLLDSGEFDVDKLAVEEDKGISLGVAVARELELPLAVARWYTYDIDGFDDQRVHVPIDSEYFSGDLYLNGVEAGDEVAVVDDTISTGGTMVAMIDAIREAGAEVAEAHCVVEKRGNGGVERVREETGVEVSTAVTVEVTEDGVRVVE